MVIVSTSFGSIVDSLGKNIESSSTSAAHPVFGASTSSSVFGEQKFSLFGSTSSQFGGSTFSFQNRRNAFQQSSSIFGSVNKPDSSNFDRAPINYSFGTSHTVMLSNLAHGSTSSIFGVSNGPHCTPSVIQASTTQGFGVRSTPSLCSTSESKPSSLFGPKNTSALGVPSTSNFFTSNISGFQASSIPPTYSFQLDINPTGVGLTEDASIHEKDLSAIEKSHQEDDDEYVVIEIREDDVLSKMPKVPDEYYTEPSIEELAEMESAEPGYCSSVKDFVVGRKGYGKVTFVGERDVRYLDLGNMVRFYKKK